MKKQINLLFVTLVALLALNFYANHSEDSQSNVNSCEQITFSEFELHQGDSGQIKNGQHSTPEKRENDDREEENKEDETSTKISDWSVLSSTLCIKRKLLCVELAYDHIISHVPIYVLQHSWKSFLG